MNKRDIKLIAYEIAARILERALDAGEYLELSAMDEIATDADNRRLGDCIEEIVNSLDKRAERRQK